MARLHEIMFETIGALVAGLFGAGLVIWIGGYWRKRTTANQYLSVVRPEPTNLPLAPSVYAKRCCPECTGANDFLEWRQSIDLGGAAFGDFVPPANLNF